jgi:hypothetical protein
MCKQCDASLSRRALLRYGAGAAAAASLFATPLTRAFGEEGSDQVDLSVPQRGKAKQVVLLFMSGGASHIDTFDPKPGAPTNGPTKAIPTAVPGVHIASSLPLLAKQMGDIALLRGMTSKEGNHERARYLMHTGYPPTPTVMHAGLGSIVSHELGRKEAALPEYIAVNGPGARPGYLGVHHAPFAIQVRPSADAAARAGADLPGQRRARGGNRPVVQNLELAGGMSAERRDRRLDFHEKLNERFARDRAKQTGEAQKAMFERARRLMDTPQNTAFDLGTEKPETLARYGPTQFGMGCLMARRLIDEGVRCVEVLMGGWDTHEDGFNRVTALNGQLDAGASALLSDLKASGKLDETLVVWVGDFGRTPRIDTGRNGRGHYPRAWSAWMAGGGVQGGRAIGATDKNGETVIDRPVTPQDLYASIAHAAGIDGSKTFFTGQGRPIQIVYKDGRVVKELFTA